MKLKSKPKSSDKIPYHKFIATGGKPSEFKASKGISEKTINKLSTKK